MRKLLVALVLGVSLLAPASALAALCSDDVGQVCCWNEPSLGWSWTHASEWDTWDPGYDYYARRRKSDNSISYNHYVSGGYWYFENSVDVYRRTALYRDGPNQTYYYMAQYAKGSCW